MYDVNINVMRIECVSVKLILIMILLKLINILLITN